VNSLERITVLALVRGCEKATSGNSDSCPTSMTPWRWLPLVSLGSADVGAVGREVMLPNDGVMSYAANSYYVRESV
jgi:hypothetical protein